MEDPGPSATRLLTWDKLALVTGDRHSALKRWRRIGVKSPHLNL